jgi:hypothetical protein
MSLHHNIEDINIEEAVEQMNGGNAWLKHLQGGPKGRPYLEVEGKKRVKPKVLHISANQRRVHLSG